jgi:hypothetical protein
MDGRGSEDRRVTGGPGDRAKDWELVRLSPPKHRGQRVRLDASQPTALLGRSGRCGIRLYSSSASRVHAELSLRSDGVWSLHARAGCLMLADGAPVDGDCELCEGLQLSLGGDRFRVQAFTEDDRQAAAEAADRLDPRGGLSRLALLRIFGFLVGSLLLLLLWRFAC